MAESKKKKVKKNIPMGVAHVNATFNNTIITITDPKGNTISWSSACCPTFTRSAWWSPRSLGDLVLPWGGNISCASADNVLAYNELN